MNTRILPEFELLAPQTIEEAVGFLDQYGENIAIMAGGTDLMVLMKSGFSPAYVLTLNEISGLRYTDFTIQKGLRLGARATLSKVLETPEVEENYPALYASVLANGTPQTKNTATVVGNILRASPAGDCCCAVLAYGGRVLLRGPAGTREVSIDDFWIDYRVTAREPSELAVELRIPAPEPGTVSAFSAITRTKKDLSKINAAVSLQLNGNICENARLAVGAVARTPIRLRKAETYLKGKEMDDTALKELQKMIPREVSPIDDVRSTAEYRRELAGVLVSRTIQNALSGLNS